MKVGDSGWTKVAKLQSEILKEKPTLTRQEAWRLAVARQDKKS